MGLSALRRWAALLAVVLAVLAGTGAMAQSSDAKAPDYDAWDKAAQEAEAALSDGDSTTSALILEREAVAAWRAKFLDAENLNKDRVATLKAQIDALGAAPDTSAGETEPEDIAARRQALTKQLKEAEAPQIRAQEAYKRANGIIAAIDDRVRTRQTEALLERVPAPINPANWPAAAQAVIDVADTVRGEIAAAHASEEQRHEILRRAPVTLGLVAAALLLLARGRGWMTLLTDLVQSRRGHGRMAVGFLVSVTQVLVPVGGIVLLTAAILSLRLAGHDGTALLQGVTRIVVTVYGALWLANRVFPLDPTLPTLFGFDDATKRGLRRTVILIGTFSGLSHFTDALTGLDAVEPPAGAVITLPVIALLAYGYWRLSRQLRRAVRAAAPGEEAPGFALLLAGLLWRALAVAAVVGLLASVAGYAALARAIVMPTATTLWLVGVFIALQWPIRDLYAWAIGSEIEKASDGLVPVLVNFALLIGAMPLLALVWGMRPEQLSEIFARFAEGVTLGGVRLTPSVVITVVAVFALGFGLTRFIQSALKSTVLPRTRLDAGSRNAVSSFVGYVGIGLAALFAITSAGIDLTALAYVFGALSLGIGFGLQNIVQNFVAGIILLIERPIGEGDWIEVGGQMGIVKRISVRSTTIETFDKQDVIVPNADFISGTVTNWTRGSAVGRAIVEVGVAYGTDTRRVEEILMEIAHEHPVVAHYPEPGVDFMGFGASSLDFRIRMILRDVNRLVEVQSEVRHRIAERFAEEGIEIPFTQYDLWLRNPDALRPPPPAAAAPAAPAARERADPEPQDAPEPGNGGEGD